ncbi:MAG: hypothetical protein A2Y45_05710 [Tenericutes bacterium GWC2_34_14]|nr:MAG: hypothetical protein A2Y45_05710 [Tenericutes bacterium GWC2_34_14]OHE33642.1 MAG: hypothetical protein A2012_04100 [Tenericutes bacterium GWE2_34_108]OHE36927.1 MAG: hypothetical protein A2Y46_09900 [Tenericutes bacterium GWF1_35_14]OHE37993.1 MAG: hypothetical protein A2Y44_08765 [Tenericutes bacterium GWF2_35_184]OHE42062.1 MAG: hypothetical protein A3K26_09580 [Tenericutes bacterium RIFOXYA12_FULL_35_10]OHE43490.1 MAG: hypothetical protein A2221_06970 [Tenericutes bacterium RIFOXYA
MKKSLSLIFIITLLLYIPFFIVNADFGPKRTLDVEIVGIDEPYHIELLMRGELPTGDDLSDARTMVADAFNDYPNMLFTFDSAGYVPASLLLPWGSRYQSPQDNYYIYSYNPPSEFKVMLVFDDGHYIISKRIQTSLFNSKVTFNVSGLDLDADLVNVGTINEVFPVQTMTLELALRIVGTIFIEILVLFLFGYVQKKSYKLIGIVNLVTQLTLTGFMFAAKYFIFPGLGEIFVLIMGEVMIFGAEIVIYRFYLSEKSKNRAMVYALVANTIALIASYSVMILMLNM